MFSCTLSLPQILTKCLHIIKFTMHNPSYRKIYQQYTKIKTHCKRDPSWYNNIFSTFCNRGTKAGRKYNQCFELQIYTLRQAFMYLVVQEKTQTMLLPNCTRRKKQPVYGCIFLRMLSCARGLENLIIQTTIQSHKSGIPTSNKLMSSNSKTFKKG